MERTSWLGYIFGTNVIENIDYVYVYVLNKREIELFARSFSFVHMPAIPDGPGA